MRSILANTLFIQPQSIFGVQWSAYMIFMVLVGGLGTFEGPILGALLFFVVQNQFADAGAWYLIGLGTVAIAFALFLPEGHLEPAHRPSSSPPASGRLPSAPAIGTGSRREPRRRTDHGTDGRPGDGAAQSGPSTVQHYIDGNWQAAVSGTEYAKYNPWTGQVLTTVAAGDAEDARNAIAAAYAARGQWADTSPSDRQHIFLRAADLLDRRADEIARPARGRNRLRPPLRRRADHLQRLPAASGGGSGLRPRRVN